MRVEFHFDFGSPNAYLSHLVIPGIEARTGIRFDYVPVLLGGLFKATGNASPAETISHIESKWRYQEIETRRFLKRHNITKFERNPYFPVNTLQIMRGAIFAQRQGYLAEYVDAIYGHMWSAPRKMDEPDIIAQALTDSGFNAKEILAGIQDPAVKQQLIDNTNRSVEMGSFGSPTFYVENEIFFGKDRLADVEDEIMSRR